MRATGPVYLTTARCDTSGAESRICRVLASPTVPGSAMMTEGVGGGEG